jgi:hypothetical protein
VDLRPRGANQLDLRCISMSWPIPAPDLRVFRLRELTPCHITSVNESFCSLIRLLGHHLIHVMLIIFRVVIFIFPLDVVY